MMVFKKRICITLMAVLLMLSAYSNTVQQEETLPEESRAENLFTTPALEDDRDEEATTHPGYTGSITHGFADKSLINDNGLYQLYTGGEMYLPYSILVTDSLEEPGIGLLLILDGQPQPYKTDEYDTYSYVHTFYPTAGSKMVFDLIFTPVTGKEGDTLELTTMHLLGPDYYPNEYVIAGMQTNGSISGATQLIFQATPPEADEIPVTERVLSQSITYEELTSEDIAGWSSEQLNNDASFEFITDHVESSYNIYSISKEKPLTIYAEVFGAPSVDWSLILYIDHQPVSVKPENMINFNNQSGKKTLIECTLDLSDFDGESIFYAVLYVRNWREPEVSSGTNCSTWITSTYYLTDAGNLQEMGQKYGR